MAGSDAGAAKSRMQDLRSRIRRLILTSGMARLVLLAAVLLVLSFGLDVLLDLPRYVRFVSAGIAAAILLVAAVRMIVRPLSVRLTDDDLALAAEARLPELRDRLISATQFRRRLADERDPESRTMMQAVVAEADAAARQIEAKRVAEGRSVRRHVAAAAGAAGVLLLLVLLFPATASLWAKRNLLLLDLEWPRRTTLVVEGFPESREIVVTRGETLRVEAVAHGRIPDDVRIGYAREGDGGDALERPMFADEERPGRFRYEFRQVPGSFRFWVNGGDDDDGAPVYTVKALVPPTIERIEAAVVFPVFTAMPPETFREGDLDLPEGSEVALTLFANMPLAEATIRTAGNAPAPLALSDGGRTATASFTADRSFEYEIALVGPEGQRNPPDSARFRVRVVPDRKPQVRILTPGEQETFTPEASIPVKVLANDNYGVASITLHYRRGAEGDFLVRPFAPEELSAPAGAKEIVAYALLPAMAFGGPEGGVKPGDDVTWFVECSDNNGNTDRSGRSRLEFLSREDLERRLSQRQILLREDLQEIRRDQETAWRQTRDFVRFLDEGGSLEARDRERVRDGQILQGKVGRETNRFYEAISRVLVSYVVNRLSAPLATERLLGFLDDHLESDRTDLHEVFKKDLFHRIVRDYRQGNILDQEVLAILIEIIDGSLRIADEASPRAHEVLTELSRGDLKGDVKAELARVEELQRGILDTLAEIDRRMQRWETYAALILDLRELKDRQTDIRQGADRARKGD